MPNNSGIPKCNGCGMEIHTKHYGEEKCESCKRAMEKNACDLCGKEIPAADKFPEATACKECIAEIDKDL